MVEKQCRENIHNIYSHLDCMIERRKKYKKNRVDKNKEKKNRMNENK